MAYNTLSSDRFTAGQSDRTFGPRVDNHQYYPLIWMTGGINTAESYGYIGFQAHLDALMVERFSGAMPSIPGQLGNATAKATIAATRQYLIDRNRGKSGKIILSGRSNGCVSSMLYAADHPEQIAGIVGFLPPIDAQYLYDNNTGGLQASYEAAYGITYPTPLPNGASPMDASVLAAIADIPILLYYASNDTITTGGDKLDDFVAATNTTLVDVGALGHTDAAVEAADTQQIVDFCTSL